MVNLLKKVWLEAGVNEEFKDRAIRAIIFGTRIGEIVDGKIFVLDIADCVRIRSVEVGAEAIG